MHRRVAEQPHEHAAAAHERHVDQRNGRERRQHQQQALEQRRQRHRQQVGDEPEVVPAQVAGGMHAVAEQFEPERRQRAGLVVGPALLQPHLRWHEHEHAEQQRQPELVQEGHQHHERQARLRVGRHGDGIGRECDGGVEDHQYREGQHPHPVELRPAAGDGRQERGLHETTPGEWGRHCSGAAAGAAPECRADRPDFGIPFAVVRNPAQVHCGTRQARNRGAHGRRR